MRECIELNDCEDGNYGDGGDDSCESQDWESEWE